jgi:hypothetical protein
MQFFKGFKNNLSYTSLGGGEAVIGAVVFVIAFVLFLLISLAAPLVPGSMIVEEYIPDLIGTGSEGLVAGIINGVIFGIIIWLVFTIVKMVYDKMQGPKEVVVKVETKDEKETKQ